MRKEELNNALNHIDYDLVEEFVEEKEELNKSLAKRRTIMHLAPIAASFVVVFCIGVAILPMFFGAKGEAPPSNPGGFPPEIEGPGAPPSAGTPPYVSDNSNSTSDPGGNDPSEALPPEEDITPPSDPTDKPEGEVGDEIACPYLYEFTVYFEGDEYICCFGAPNEIDYYEALERYVCDSYLVGEYLGVAQGIDANGFARQFKIYKVALDTDRDIIIEIEDGYFFIATK